MSTADNQATAGAAFVQDVIHPDVLVMRIIGLTSGQPHPAAGKWLKEYDPTRRGTGPNGKPTTSHIVCTSNPFEAMRFNSPVELHQCWMTESGRPAPANRPLTAFIVLAEPLIDHSPGGSKPWPG